MCALGSIREHLERSTAPPHLRDMFQTISDWAASIRAHNNWQLEGAPLGDTTFNFDSLLAVGLVPQEEAPYYFRLLTGPQSKDRLVAAVKRFKISPKLRNLLDSPAQPLLHSMIANRLGTKSATAAAIILHKTPLGEEAIALWTDGNVEKPFGELLLHKGLSLFQR